MNSRHFIGLPERLKHWGLLLCALAVFVCGETPADAQTRPGEVFQDRFTDGSGQGPDMVVLPSGTSVIGHEPGRSRSEPWPTVRIGYRLAVGRFEVTFAEWDRCSLDGGCNGYSPPDLEWGRADRPVIYVSWNDAQAYLDWLNRKTGLTGRAERYRLLSEAEWEYAARAGSRSRWSFGDDESRIGSFAWFQGNSSARTQPVGGKTANPFGLHDMHGNVAEWVEDCWSASYASAPSDGSGYTSAGCSLRTLRSGSWYFSPRNLRSASRSRSTPDSRSNDRGFRIARTLPP
jgi:formylglycine-generating enzyme required for sulfatase activity